MAQVFQGQVLDQKWRKRHRNAQVGDVVLIKNETVARVEFQRERAMEANPEEEGHMWLVELTYKNPSEVFRSTVHHIQKVVGIVPMDYLFQEDKARAVEAEAVKQEETSPSKTLPEAVGRSCLKRSC
jgi:hypothetical protein